MKPSFVAFSLAFSLVLTPSVALAATPTAPSTTRTFVQTTKSFWRSAFGVRNTFDTGFTADLSDLQVKIAKFAGLKPIVVKKFNILADTITTPTPQPTPTDLLPWGVKFMLGGINVSKVGGGKGVILAILDTGIDSGHPDLKDRVTACADYSALSKSFIDKECQDANGHGTHMAGIIAADGGPDGAGIWGLAPETSLQIYKVCGADGSCLSDDIAMGITAAVDNGANIIVLGLGGENASSFVDDAITYAKNHEVMIIVAAGNDGPYDDSMDWPAKNPDVVAVGALGSDSAVADFSSRGEAIEFAAPGVNIESTFKDDGYAILSGTSMAAPHVAGIAARIWKKDAAHPAQATREFLHTLAKDIVPMGDDNGSGWGVPAF